MPQPGAQLMSHLLLRPWAGTCLCSYLKTKHTHTHPPNPQQPNKKTNQPNPPPNKKPRSNPSKSGLPAKQHLQKKTPNTPPKQKVPPMPPAQNKAMLTHPHPHPPPPTPSQQTGAFCEHCSRYHGGRKERNEPSFQKILRLETGTTGGCIFLWVETVPGVCVSWMS